MSWDNTVQLEAQAAAMREALERALGAHHNLYKSVFGEHSSPVDDLVRRQMLDALLPDAGKALLERLRKAETEREEWRVACMFPESTHSLRPWTRVVQKLQAERDEARAVLREVEWVDEVGGHEACFWCQRINPELQFRVDDRPAGHAPDCRLKKALGAT